MYFDVHNTKKSEIFPIKNLFVGVFNKTEPNHEFTLCMSQVVVKTQNLECPILCYNTTLTKATETLSEWIIWLIIREALYPTINVKLRSNTVFHSLLPPFPQVLQGNQTTFPKKMILNKSLYKKNTGNINMLQAIEKTYWHQIHWIQDKSKRLE